MKPDPTATATGQLLQLIHSVLHSVLNAVIDSVLHSDNLSFEG